MSSEYTIPESLLPYLTGSKTDYGSVQDSIIKINAIFIPLVVLSTGSRFYVRFRMLRAAGLDDIFMILALLFAILLSTSCLLGERFGLGKHLWNLNSDLLKLPEDVARVTKVLFAAYLSYSTAITFTKFSILATYLRIFPPGVYLRWIVYVVGIVVMGFWISSIFAIIFTCVPVQAAWDYSITNAKCYGVLHYFYVAAGFNILTDLLLCLLPMPVFWSLSMPRSQRLVLCMLFGMGIFACIASAIRLTQLHHLSGVDVPYQSVGSLNWSLIEVGTAIICASLSALRPLASYCFPDLFSHFSSNTEGGTGTISRKVAAFDVISSTANASRVSTQIYVHKTFDVLELQQLPSSPGRARLRPTGIDAQRREFFERDSQEDLVMQK